MPQARPRPIALYRWLAGRHLRLLVHSLVVERIVAQQRGAAFDGLVCGLGAAGPNPYVTYINECARHGEQTVAVLAPHDVVDQ